jgi:hypothetical protein
MIVRSRTSVRITAAVGVLVTLCAAEATTFTDNFESYAAGTFPAANWIDSATVAPENGPPPNPSCSVGVTTDAFGQPTQALHLDPSWVGTASGIYRSVDTLEQYSLAMDVRTDVFAPGAQQDGSDWPWMLGVSKYAADRHAGAWNSLMIYGTDLNQDFRDYAISASYGEEDLPLGVAEAAGVWYRVQLDVDATSGALRNRIWRISDGALLLDATVVASGWTPADGLFDSVTINQGERSASGSADAWVDNISITATPEPASGLALAATAALLGLRRRAA